MDLTSVIKQNRSREKRLQFIRAHQNAFDVDPLFPMQLFEDFVVGVEGNCLIEVSCKVELDKLVASRSLLFFDRTVEPSHCLRQTLDFFSLVERRIDVKIDYSLLEKFMQFPNCLSIAIPKSCGIDLRSNLSESSLKTHFKLNLDRPVAPSLNLIEFALSLCSLDNYSLELLNTLNKYIPKHKLIPNIGFDLYLDGSTEIEMYLEITEEYLKHSQVREVLQQNFSTKVLAPLASSNIVMIGLSQPNSNPVFYIQLKNKQDFSHYFLTNSTIERVVSFYRQQTTLPYIWVAGSKQELEKNRIESIRLYYHFNG